MPNKKYNPLGRKQRKMSYKRILLGIEEAIVEYKLSKLKQ